MLGCSGKMPDDVQYKVVARVRHLCQLEGLLEACLAHAPEGFTFPPVTDPLASSQPSAMPQVIHLQTNPTPWSKNLKLMNLEVSMTICRRVDASSCVYQLLQAGILQNIVLGMCHLPV